MMNVEKAKKTPATRPQPRFAIRVRASSACSGHATFLPQVYHLTCSEIVPAACAHDQFGGIPFLEPLTVTIIPRGGAGSRVPSLYRFG